jgi:tRNA-5-methyluridine54 2-sulfurtransferase
MRCRKCGQKAAINLHEHRLALCKDDFLEWLPQYIEKTIHKYSLIIKNEKVLVAVSGGKDSLSLWEILWRLGYITEGIHINLGIEGETNYSNDSEQFARAFASKHDLFLNVVNIQSEFGKNIHQVVETAKHGKEKPCSTCGLIKRYILNKYALDGGYDVLATAHNLDDDAATLMLNSLNWKVNLISRQSPALPAHDGFVRKVKPFFRTYEREAAAYAVLQGIEYIYEECPFSVGNPQIEMKQVLDNLELHQPGLKLSYYLEFLKAKENGFFSSQQIKKDETKTHHCLICKQMTSNYDEICSFCKLMKI